MEKLDTIKDDFLKERNFPQYLKDSPLLKPKLSWLYYTVYNEYPIVRSSFADVLIAAYSARYFGTETKDNIVDVLFSDAVKALMVYPHTLSEIHRKSIYGCGYTLFSTPACFFIPHVFFFMEKEISLSPFDFLVPDLRESIKDSFCKDLQM